jgi:hypothetical protein
VRWGAAAFAVIAAAAPARGDVAAAAPAHSGGFLHDLVAEVRAKLDAIADGRAPKLVPPRAVAVTWKPRRIASLELGAPLVAMLGDERGVLWAVTTKEVIALATTPHVHELARAAFAGDPAVPTSRDPVGAAVVDGHGRAIVASASPWAKGLRVALDSGAPAASSADAQFTLCGGRIKAQLVPGMNYFDDGANPYLALGCAELHDANGTPELATARLGLTHDLRVSVAACTTGSACGDGVTVELANVGTAFAIADVDRDGTPEIVFASAAAPGDADAIAVVSVGDDEQHAKFHKAFPAGGVAAIAVLDTDPAVAPAVIAAVRLVGSTRVDLWRLD